MKNVNKKSLYTKEDLKAIERIAIIAEARRDKKKNVKKNDKK